MLTETTDSLVLQHMIDAATILIFISIADRELYKRIGTNAIPTKELHNYLRDLDYSLIGDQYDEKFIVNISLRFLLRDAQEDKNLEIAHIYAINNNKFQNGNNEDIKEVLNELTQSMGDYRRLPKISGFESLYSILESCRPLRE